MRCYWVFRSREWSLLLVSEAASSEYFRSPLCSRRNPFYPALLSSSRCHFYCSMFSNRTCYTRRKLNTDFFGSTRCPELRQGELHKRQQQRFFHALTYSARFPADHAVEHCLAVVEAHVQSVEGKIPRVLLGHDVRHLRVQAKLRNAMFSLSTARPVVEPELPRLLHDAVISRAKR